MSLHANFFKVILALTVAAALPATAQTNFVPVTARDFYNVGTRLLAEKKFEEAEKMLEAALAAQDELVQPAALYNVGEERFSAGLDRLKKGPDAQKVSQQGGSALAAGDQALKQGEAALASNNINDMINAYLEGRGARHNLREAEKAVSAGIDTYGKTLEQWLRATDDFKGTKELNPADTNALPNAETVDRGIARLIDSVHKMQEMMGAMGQKRQDLGKLLAKMKGQIPAQNAPPGQAGDDDEDENKGVTPASLTGKKEGATKQGEEMQVHLSPDQAAQLLNGLSLDSNKRLDQLSDKQGSPQKDRKGRIW